MGSGVPGFHGRLGQELRHYRLKDLDQNVYKMIGGYLSPHKFNIAMAIMAMVIVSVVNVLAPYLVKVAIDDYILVGNAKGLLWILAAYAGLYSLFWLASYWSSRLSSEVGQSIVAAIRKDLYSHVLGLSLDFYEKRKTGEILSRLTGDVDQLSDLVSRGFVGAVSDSVTLVASFALMFALSWKMALVSLSVLPLIWGGTAIFGRLMRSASREVREKAGHLSAGVEQNIAGMKVVQSMSGQETSVAKLDKLSKEAYAANLKSVLASALFFPFMSSSGVLSSALVLWAGGNMVARGTLSPGLLVAFMSYVSRFFLPLRDLSQLYGLYQNAAASAERIYDYMKLEPTVKESASPVKIEGPLKGDIAFTDVSFSYSKERDVFSGLTFEAPGGCATAIVGPSGAGKSTAVKLLARLYDVQNGSITIDGIDVRDYSNSDLRSLIGFVPQDVVLFPGTVAQNIAFGNPKASLDEIIEVARKCSLDEVVGRLKNGYETQVGERGARLSGGQRQLVSFARALLMNRPILILDEATSSVDALTEGLIQSAMEELTKNRTTIMIAHRLSTIKRASSILVFDKGRVVGQGTHDKLYETVPLYKELCRKQALR